MTEDFIDLETGEVLDLSLSDDAVLNRLITRRHDAKSQEDSWKKLRVMCDAQIMARMGSSKIVVDDLVATVKSRSSSHTDAVLMAKELRGAEVGRGDLLATISTANGFKAADLPPAAREAYDAATTVSRSAQWIETGPVLRRSP